MSVRTNRWGLDVDEKRPHLGGYVKGGDPHSWSPELWDWLIGRHGVRSMVDVGCGTGETVGYFAARGCDALGVDGIAQEHYRVIQHDYTEGPYPDPLRYGTPRGTVDLVWSAEFVEHVEEAFLPNFLFTFGQGNLVAFTHATPGQGGHHHVNEQTSDYWRGVMAAYGYSYEPELTQEARNLVAHREGNYFARTGLLFRRRV